MHWSTDALEVLGSQLHEVTEQSRQPHRLPPLRTAVRRTPASPRPLHDARTRPDYGCVDWFVYDDQQQESA